MSKDDPEKKFADHLEDARTQNKNTIQNFPDLDRE